MNTNIEIQLRARCRTSKKGVGVFLVLSSGWVFLANTQLSEPALVMPEVQATCVYAPQQGADYG